MMKNGLFFRINGIIGFNCNTMGQPIATVYEKTVKKNAKNVLKEW